jgi:hypothetical protein
MSNTRRIVGLQITSGELPFAWPIRVLDMRTVRLPRGRVVLLGLFMSSHFWLSGCTDESKTSGTAVERSEQDIAHLKSKIGSYKGGPPKKEAAGKKQ